MFSPSDWRVPFAPENPRLKQFSPSNLPGSLPTEKTVKNRKNEKTMKKPRGKTPKERHENPPRKHGPTTTRRTKPKPKTERDRDNLGQTGRCVVSLDTVFPECDRSLWSVVGQAFWLVHGSLAVCKAHWPSSLDGSPSSSLSSSSSCCCLGGIGTSSCRDNLQKPVAPRRQGSWVPSPSSAGVFGAPPFFLHRCHPRGFESSSFLWHLGRFSLWVASPGVLSQLPASLGRFMGRRPFVRSTIARWQEATDPQSPKGGSQRARHTWGAHPTASGCP